MTLAQRKAIITFSRIGEDFVSHSPYIIQISRSFTYSQWTNLKLINTPILRSFLLSCARNGPITEEDKRKQERESFEKEYRVLTSEPGEQRLNFAAFSDISFGTLLPEFPINPYAVKAINEGFDKWFDQVANIPILYPKMSTKSVSYETRDLCRELGYCDNVYISEDVTQVDLERIYHKYGDIIGGANEMRQIYYPSQFAVRTYYSSGGDSYSQTKYIGKPLTMLCETLDVSSKLCRNSPARIVLDDDEYAFIYDFTSYTTNLREHVPWLVYLSQRVGDIGVMIMDSRKGAISCTLSSLIWQCKIAHELPPINIRQYITKVVYPQVHNAIAGLLGIKGNIPSAIHLHGCVALYLKPVPNCLRKVNTPGDDGLRAQKDNEMRDIKVGLRSLGEFQMEKTYDTRHSGCLHLKRSIVQSENHLILIPNVYFPSFEYEMSDEKIDTRYYKAISRLSKKDRKEAVASTVTSFLKSIVAIDVSDIDRSFIRIVLRYIYDNFGLPYEGNVPQFTDSSEHYFCCTFPSLAHDYSRCPITFTIKSNYTRCSRLPDRRFIDSMTDLRLVDKGDVFLSNGNGLTGYLTHLGYLEKRLVMVDVFDDELYDKTISEYVDDHERGVYEFVVMSLIPYRLLSYECLC